MPRYPHTKLFHDPRHIVVLSGPHIQVLDPQGRVLCSTASLPPAVQEAVIKNGPTRCSGMSSDGRFLATAGDDKQLKIWDLESLTLLSTRLLPKKPTSIGFSRKADVLVSDKFGDVFRYAFCPNDERVEGKLADATGGELVLGHASLMTTCLLTLDEMFIITADRDEHIRVSWYPEGYVIESYCLGHKKYVSAIHIPAAFPASLISGGGDLELKVWDWKTGRLQRNITVFPAVEPFIRVRPQNRKNRSSGEHDDDDDEAMTSSGGKNKARKTKRQHANAEPDDVELHDPSVISNETSEPTAPVLVVGRISSFLAGGEHHVVFSAVGATAIFEFVLTETDSGPIIRHHDFGKPVIDFSMCGERIIWVLLDADFPEESNDTGQRPRELVQAVRWSADQFVDAGRSALLDSLNAACSLPATAEDLKTLDLYADLSALPKNIVDTERGQGRASEQCKTSTDERMQDEPAAGDATSVTQAGLTKRAVGRLKHKQALNQLQQDKLEASCPDAKKVKVDPDEEA